MMFALGAVSSALDMLQSLGASKSSSTSATGQTQSATASNPFDPASGTGTQGQVSTGFSVGNGGPTISPQTMSALIQAQSQSGTANTAPTDPSRALKDLFSQIDGNGDGSISKSEFESALGAGGTNLAAADDVFNKLDANGDGSVTLDEMKSALQGAGHHGGHHHMHAGGSDGSNDQAGGDSNTDPLMQALNGASSTSVTNSDGSTTTSITYADGSKVTMTTPAASSSASTSSSSSATSSYNLIEKMIQREAQSLSASLSQSFSVNA
jgi:EF-hand domain pair